MKILKGAIRVYIALSIEALIDIKKQIGYRNFKEVILISFLVICIPLIVSFMFIKDVIIGRKLFKVGDLINHDTKAQYCIVLDDIEFDENLPEFVYRIFNQEEMTEEMVSVEALSRIE